MSEPILGPNWRQVTIKEYGPYSTGRERAIVYDKDAKRTYWVREDPVPPLPTEPYTVIRVTWKEGLRPDARELVRWSATWESEDNLLTPEELANRITGFEVLAEPRAGAVMRAEESARRLTVKAVLDRVHEHEGEALSQFRAALDRLARDFGVSS